MKTKHKLFNYIIPFAVDGLSIQERKFPKKILYTVIENDVLKPDHEKLLELYKTNFYQKETLLGYEEFNAIVKDIFVNDLSESFCEAMMYVYGNFTETLDESVVMENASADIFLKSHAIIANLNPNEKLIKEWFDFQDVVGHYQEWEYGENGNKAMYDNIDEEYDVYHKIANLIYSNNWVLTDKEYALFKEKGHLFEEVLFGEE